MIIFDKSYQVTRIFLAKESRSFCFSSSYSSSLIWDYLVCTYFSCQSYWVLAPKHLKLIITLRQRDIVKLYLTLPTGFNCTFSKHVLEFNNRGIELGSDGQLCRRKNGQSGDYMLPSSQSIWNPNISIGYGSANIGVYIFTHKVKSLLPSSSGWQL